MVTEDQDILDQIAELRRQRAAEMQAMQSDNNPLGVIVSGGLGGIADAFSAGAGRTSNYAGEAIAANQAATKGARDMRLKALEGSGEEIKALNELAKSRAGDRKTAGLYEQQAKLAQLAENGRNNRSELDRKAHAERDANRAEKAPRGMMYVSDAETGAESLVPIPKTLPAETAAKFGNTLGAALASTNIEKLGATMPTGRMSSIGDWLQEHTGTQSVDRAKALANIGTQRNEVMSKIAGANVTPDEKARIQEGIPTRTDAPEQFAGKAQSTTDYLINKAESEIMALEAAGYDTAKLRAQVNQAKQMRDAARVAKATPPSSGIGLDMTPEANAAAPVGHPDPAKEARRQQLLNKAQGL